MPGKFLMRLTPLAIAVTASLLLSGDLESRPRAAHLQASGITVESAPISFDSTRPEKRKYGRLQWRGGLVLTSNHKSFGGYSGIALSDKGRRLIAVSDQGTWLTADLSHNKGMLSGLANTRIGPILARNGRRLRRKHFTDAEEIQLWRNRQGVYALISFERAHRIGRFPLTKAGLAAPRSYLKLPRAIFKGKRNKGLEALTVLTSGRNSGNVLTFAERLVGKNGHHQGWLIRGKRHWPLYLTRSDDFDVTGLATLPNGNVLVLERSFSYFTGVRMRIREIKAANIKPGAVLKGKRLIRASMRFNIDNMEGISAHKNAKGETIVTLISDDNFNKNGLQKTVLMQFKLD